MKNQILNYRRNLRVVQTLIGVYALLSATLEAQTTVKLNGAPPIAQPVKNKQGDIETKSGNKLEVLFTNNPRGVDALRAGEADIALLAPSVKQVVDAMNAAKPGSASAEGLQEFPVGESSVSLIVHPGNAVNALTTQQARDIFSGKTTNWKDVGGADAPIQVFVLDPAIIPRIVIENKVMAGTPVAKDAVVRSKPTDIPPIVAQTPNAISFTGTAVVTANVKTLKFDDALKFPMLFVTKGEPNAATKSVIEAAQAVFAQK